MHHNALTTAPDKNSALPRGAPTAFYWNALPRGARATTPEAASLTGNRLVQVRAPIILIIVALVAVAPGGH